MKSERMAPLVEMLPANFLAEVPPSPAPELDPELELGPDEDPEPEPQLAPDPELVEPEADEEALDPELEPAPDPDGGPKGPPPEDEVVDDESPSEFEPAPVPGPPASSLDHWLEPVEEPQAMRTDETASGSKSGRERER
ncbi:MAG: hypothetical protein ACRENE_24550 [Polyangiaceae bacterium]